MAGAAVGRTRPGARRSPQAGAGRGRRAADVPILLRSDEEGRLLFGHQDAHLKVLEEACGVETVARGVQLTLRGPAAAVRSAGAVVAHLLTLIRNGRPLHVADVLQTIQAVRSGADVDALARDRIEVLSALQFVTPKTAGQQAYVEAIRSTDMVFAIGPAGTGKTYLATAMAVAALKHRQVTRIIMTRPAVEAGESLGFLPGDLSEKITPYLRPIYDALYEMMERETVRQYLDRGVLEIAPLAYMRGRTLNDSFVILDEAQNATSEQMKMFLTRLGFGSRAVITGDVTQVDLPSHKRSGLIEVQTVLAGLAGIRFVQFTSRDVVRHPLVQEIIDAYRAHQEH